MHALRHFYASVLLDAGENIKAVAEYLGHSGPGLTLRVYAHLMPSTGSTRDRRWPPSTPVRKSRRPQPDGPQTARGKGQAPHLRRRCRWGA
ncbi:tyrosine-type recombinase/integrase [Streptomyces sp. NPDC001552]|uniref:tyrosine-type recombinase/integrase n=1 Tax=Streptomyces sp. NPDC001552 TaxID=3364587 RepID=UPI0036C94331